MPYQPPSRHDEALPAWITPELIALTLKTWQPFYPDEKLTEADAAAILLTMGNLYRLLTGDAADEAEQVPSLKNAA